MRDESITDSANYSDSCESHMRNDNSIDAIHDYDDGPCNSEHYSVIPDNYNSPNKLYIHPQNSNFSLDAIELPRSFGIADFQALDHLGDVDISRQRPIVHVDSNPPSPATCFQYEDEFEFQVEHSLLARDSTLDSLRTKDLETLFTLPKPLHLKHLKKVYADGIGYESTATDDTMCSDNKKTIRKHRHKTDSRIKRRLITSHLDSSTKVRDDDNDADTEDNKDDGFSERTSSLADESFDSAIDSCMSTSDSPSTESYHNIQPKSPSTQTYDFRQETLQERVERLRMEKEIVDEKINAAREEELYRYQERARLQREVALQRKTLMLQTLQDLKSKLEGQNQRLQTTYNTVLNMQKVITCQKRQQGTEHVATTCTNEELKF